MGQCSSSSGSSGGAVRDVLLASVVVKVVFGMALVCWPAALLSGYTHVHVDTEPGTTTHELLLLIARLWGATLLCAAAYLIPVWRCAELRQANSVVAFGVIPAAVLQIAVQSLTWYRLAAVRRAAHPLDASGFKAAIGLLLLELVFAIAAVVTPPTTLALVLEAEREQERLQQSVARLQRLIVNSLPAATLARAQQHAAAVAAQQQQQHRQQQQQQQQQQLADDVDDNEGEDVDDVDDGAAPAEATPVTAAQPDAEASPKAARKRGNKQK